MKEAVSSDVQNYISPTIVIRNFIREKYSGKYGYDFGSTNHFINMLIRKKFGISSIARLPIEHIEAAKTIASKILCVIDECCGKEQKGDEQVEQTADI